jgi:hypothetical protein
MNLTTKSHLRRALALVLRRAQREVEEVPRSVLRYQQLANVPGDVLEASIRQAIEAQGDQPMEPNERDIQIVNFVWGNALEGERDTRESVRKDICRGVAPA